MSKQPRNAFYFFMKELQEDKRKQGLNYSMSRMAEIATPTWQTMTREEKAFYEQQAKEEKARAKQSKRDCIGNLISENEVRILNKKNVLNDEMRTIKILISATPKDKLARLSFYFVSTQVFCRTEEDDFLPAEIAIIKYSIAEGIQDEYHQFIHPGNLPRGYRWRVMDGSARTHKIPFDNFELANRNYGRILEEMCNLMFGDGVRDFNPIVYCSIEELEQTNYILNNLLVKRSPKYKHLKFKVYNVANLMFHIYLQQRVCSLGVMMDDWLRSTAFLMKPKTCCQWHCDNDVFVCALGNAKSYGYVFSDHLCELYNVEIIPGRHFPEVESESERAVYDWHTKAQSLKHSNSNVSSFTSRTSVSTDRESDTEETNTLDWNPQLSSRGVFNLTESFGPALPGCSASNDESKGQWSKQTFADATTDKLASFNLNNEDFPDLDSRSESGSMSIRLDNWNSSSETSTPSLKDVRVRGLGRGRLARKPKE